MTKTQTRRCSVCQDVIPLLTGFYADRKAHLGRATSCKGCAKARCARARAKVKASAPKPPRDPEACPLPLDRPGRPEVADEMLGHVAHGQSLRGYSNVVSRGCESLRQASG